MATKKVLALKSYRNIMDNVHGVIRLTDLEAKVISHPIFNRLHSVYQNSTAYLTWPSMRNQRFEHSLGTMKLSGDMFNRAVQNADTVVLESFYAKYSNCIKVLIDRCDPVLVEKAFSESVAHGKQEMKKLVSQKNVSYLPGSGFCSFLVPSNVPTDWRMVHDCLAQAIRLVGLLHDVGHPPFSHVCEKALKNLYLKAQDLADSSISSRQFLECIDVILDGESIRDVDLHEEISKDLLRILMGAFVRSEDTEHNREKAAHTIIVWLISQAIYEDEGDFEFLHSLISGTLDSDRLDYVKRDSVSTGMGDSALQYSRLLEGIKLMATTDAGGNSAFCFAFPIKTLSAVEAVLKKRFENYKTIIYHHTVVKTGSFMQRAVEVLGLSYFEEHGEPDTGENVTLALPGDISGLWKPLQLGGNGESDAVLSFGQWNDAWLITALSGEYIKLKEKEIDGINDKSDGPLLCMLDELLHGVPQYQSLIKRTVDCAPFRKRLNERRHGGRREAADRILALLHKREKSESSDALDVDIDSTLSQLMDFFIGLGGNALKLISDLYMTFNLSEYNGYRYETFLDMLSAMLHDSLEENGVVFDDVVIERSMIKTGLSGSSLPVFFYDMEDELFELDEISNLRYVLENEIDEMPAVFAFLLARENGITAAQKKATLRTLADKVYDYMFAVVKQIDVRVKNT